MTPSSFLDLPPVSAESADVLLLPLPYEGTVSGASGTASGPEAVLRASAQVETWDDETGFALDALRYFVDAPLEPTAGEPPGDYLQRVFARARQLHQHGGFVVGLGGEHGVTTPLVRAAANAADDLSDVTVVQFDAHADLRDTYDGTPHSHACPMRRLVEAGAQLIAIGIRSAERAEWEFGVASDRVRTFTARRLASEPRCEAELLDVLACQSGKLYLTIDVDVLEVGLCPGTGTPVPGGLTWWQLMRYLRRLLWEPPNHELLGCDVVETAPQASTAVSELTAAYLLSKLLAYRFAA